jgi:hypothetical protein
MYTMRCVWLFVRRELCWKERDKTQSITALVVGIIMAPCGGHHREHVRPQMRARPLHIFGRRPTKCSLCDHIFSCGLRSPHGACLLSASNQYSALDEMISPRCAPSPKTVRVQNETLTRLSVRVACWDYFTHTGEGGGGGGQSKFRNCVGPTI